MKKFYAIGIIAFLLAGCSSVRFVGKPLGVETAQTKVTPLSETQKKQWHLLDLEQDSIPGISVDRAYAELIKEKKGEKVVVAIIDSGVDIEHPCLANVLWVNEDEIPNNGLDDDQNGYVDDVHGWNFLGEAEKENMEYVRLMKITEPDSDDYKTYNSFLEKEKKKVEEELPQIKALLQRIITADSVLVAATGKTDYSIEDAQAISPKTMAVMEALRMKEYMQTTGFKQSDVEGYSDYLQNRIDYHFNLNFEGRSLVGDNPDDLYDLSYGNANVSGPDLDGAQHGTHVAGIIAAQCEDPSHPKGVAQNMALMVVRAVPDGDEYDKDVALAIRYAVDNGAKVINTSFGKDFSPHPEWVYEALRYAAAKDVLIVNAAGNDNKNIDHGAAPSYPKDQIEGTEIVNNFLTVGATAAYFAENQVAPFSNFGVSEVDIFAPGANIYSTTPKNKHDFLNGTSMAAPNVAGIAAVLRSFFPKLSAATVKKIILDSGLPLFETVMHPENQNAVAPTDISKTGKIANLYNALLLASKTK